MAQIVDDRRDPGRDHGDPDRPDLPRARPVRRTLSERRAGDLRRPGGACRCRDRPDQLRRPRRFRHAQPRTGCAPAASRCARSGGCPARPPAAPSSPIGPMAAATSSSTSPTRLLPPWTPRSSSPACSRAAASSTSWARRCSAPDRRGRAARRRAGQGRGCADLVRPQHPQGAAGAARGRGHDRRRCSPSATSCCPATPTSPISAPASPRPRRPRACSRPAGGWCC